MDKNTIKLPIGVKIIARIFEVLAVVVAAFGIALIIPGSSSNFANNVIGSIKGINQNMGWRFGLFFIVLAGFLFFVSLNLGRGKKWAWWTTLVLFSLNGLSSLFELPQGLVGIVVVILLIYYLTRSKVRESFLPNQDINNERKK